MSSADGPDGLYDGDLQSRPIVLRQSVECELFESLVHLLIEKGVLTKNDALSVVQTVAEVRHGAIEEAGDDSVVLNRELRTLKRLYSSFELIRGGSGTTRVNDGGNVTRLRPPVHGDRSEFPEDCD